MSNEIISINNNFPTQVELQSVALIARTAHSSGLYAGVGGEAKIMMILLAAKELGVGPCQALNGGIWSIQGKIEISARLMNGLIRRAGHSIKVITSNDTECTLLGKRTDGDTFECSFTMDDAIKAGLAGGNVWKKYPGDMLYNRCMSRLGRRLFSDVIGQCYIEGEISESKQVESLEQAQCEYVTKPNKIPECPKLDEIEPNIPVIARELRDNCAIEPLIDKESLEILMDSLSKIDHACKINFYTWLMEKYNTQNVDQLPKSEFNRVLDSFSNNIMKNQGLSVNK